MSGKVLKSNVANKLYDQFYKHIVESDSFEQLMQFDVHRFVTQEDFVDRIPLYKWHHDFDFDGNPDNHSMLVDIGGRTVFLSNQNVDVSQLPEKGKWFMYVEELEEQIGTIF